MRKFLIALAATSGLMATQAMASDKPAIGPIPSWVKPVSLPPAPAKPAEGAVAVLLSDQQLSLERGRETVYSDVALKIQTPQGLEAGNLSFSWRPDTDEPTVHKLLIHRGDQTIDVLASGQTFTVLRRETNLDSAMLDGVLTANIQPEGLQVGDMLELAMSIRSSDPVMKGHVEELTAAWNGLPVQRAHLRVQWPSSLALRFRQTHGLPVLAPVTGPDGNTLELSLEDLQPIVAPKGAPTRYQVGRLVEVTDFKSWADIGALLSPLFAKAAVVPAQGPLRAELEKIRALSPDPKVRAEAALALVEERVRYVALVMGQGGLTPADAETTWARRFGDCKAKTVLLLALLHELNIQAEPVVVNTVAGDGMDARLPMIGLFDHVLVRATIAGKTYWLDGTGDGDGDTNLDRLEVPNYGWGLPLEPSGASLVRMLPPPLETPSESMSINLDASQGLSLPAPAHLELVFDRDGATAMNVSLAKLDAQALDRALKAFWRQQFDFIDVNSVSAAFDAKTGEERLVMDGLAHMDWSLGYYETDDMTLGFKPDFVRDPGSDQDAPYATDYPSFTRTTETIVLPPGFVIAPSWVASDLDLTVAGMAYHRHSSLQGHSVVLEKTERSLAPEFPAKDAPAAAEILRGLADKTLVINKPKNYQPTLKELQAGAPAAPKTAADYIARGGVMIDGAKYDDAVAEFDHALELEPKNVTALAGRGFAHVGKGDFAAAAKDLDAASAIEPKNPIVLRGRGLVAEGRRDYSAAIADFSLAIALNASDVFSLEHRAEDEYAAGDWDAALTDAAAVLKTNPQLVQLRLIRIEAFRRQGKIDAAAAETAALAAFTDNSYDQVAAGNAYSLLGRTQEAAQAYDRALAIKPEPYIYLNRARNRPKTDVAGRRADLDAALALDPKYAAGLIAKARLLEEQNDAAGAVALYSKGLEASPADLNLLIGRGIAYAKSGDQAHADADFAAARAHATGAGQLNNMCWSIATEGVALDSALADCDAALAMSPGSAMYLDSRAFVMLRLGRLDEAIADYTRAIHLAPRQAASMYGRGVAWSHKGDKAQGAADMAVAMKVDPAIQKTFDDYGVRP